MSLTRNCASTGFAIAVVLTLVSSPARAGSSPAYVERAGSAPDDSSQSTTTAARKHSVTVYEVRSEVAEVNARAATDMFTTALVKSRRFRVMERSQLKEGVGAERKLNADGMTTGDAGAYKLGGAGYVFEPVISEANMGESESQSQTGFGGMNVSSGKITDSIGMDVRVIDASTGEIVDAINVRKKLQSKGSSVSGVGNLLGNSMGMGGGGSLGKINPEHSSTKTQREGKDQAVRALIELAVQELARSSASW